LPAVVHAIRGLGFLRTRESPEQQGPAADDRRHTNTHQRESAVNGTDAPRKNALRSKALVSFQSMNTGNVLGHGPSQCEFSMNKKAGARPSGVEDQGVEPMALGSAGGRLPLPPIIRLDADGIGRLKHRMHRHPAYPMTRREWLRLSAGALLTLGIWPGCARWSGARRAGTFRFVAINDAHFQSPRCPAWFGGWPPDPRAGRRPDFCLFRRPDGTTAPITELGQIATPCAPSARVSRGVGNHDYVSDADRSPWSNFPKG
jgi:hypothetical protein